MFSVGEANYTNNITLYGLVQCMRDMSADECYTCLQNYIQYYKSNYAGKQGGRVYGYECFFRMETYLFFDSSFIEAPPLDQLSPAPGDKNATSSKSNKGEIAQIK
ncbi:cysteine-rich receptor-like protein kinase 15 [Carex littledalei]|uniref:Cysteine-rich receptor-like protein kinase 15 n=1 Tax=Carex littledalei TaxID=544730 RepID=A0A833QI15_9POAL|nr:cysteine-rich receptor-like protein kinase 15 [Carex littledalei]